MQALTSPDTAVRGHSVYALIDPRTGEARYVGKAKDAHQRLNGHLNDARRGQKSHKAHWVRQLLASGLVPEMVVLDEGIPAHLIDNAEKLWICMYRSMGCPLTNHSDGGPGNLGWKAEPETRQRMSEAAVRAGQDPKLKAIRSQNSKRLGLKPPVHIGEKNPTARFTEADVHEMRVLHAGGLTLGELAEAFETSTAQISLVVTGQIWAHVGGPIRQVRPKQKLSIEEVAEIRQMVSQGIPQVRAAEKFGVSPPYVSQLVSDKRRNPR